MPASPDRLIGAERTPVSLGFRPFRSSTPMPHASGIGFSAPVALRYPRSIGRSSAGFDGNGNPFTADDDLACSFSQSATGWDGPSKV